MIKFGMKLGIAAGTFYYLAEEGVWKDSEQSIKAYNKLTTTLSPYVKELSSQIPVEFPELPSTERISFVAKHYWNLGVMTSFDFMQHLPEHVTKLGCNTMQLVSSNEEIKKFMDSFTVKSAQDDEDKKEDVKKSE